MRSAPTDEERRSIHLEVRENITREWTRIQDEYENKIDKQIELAQILSRMSPSASFVYAATNLAGTGIVEFRDLADYTKQYQGRFADVVDEMHREEHAREAQRTVEQTVDEQPFDIDRLPVFRAEGDSFARSLQGSMLDIGLLVAFNIAFLLVSYIKFMRYDVCE